MQFVIVMFCLPQSQTHLAEIGHQQTSVQAAKQLHTDDVRSYSMQVNDLKHELEDTQSQLDRSEGLAQQYKGTIESLKGDLANTQQLHKNAAERVRLELGINFIEILLTQLLLSQHNLANAPMLTQ